MNVGGKDVGKFILVVRVFYKVIVVFGGNIFFVIGGRRVIF